MQLKVVRFTFACFESHSFFFFLIRALCTWFYMPSDFFENIKVFGKAAYLTLASFLLPCAVFTSFVRLTVYWNCIM